LSDGSLSCTAPRRSHIGSTARGTDAGLYNYNLLLASDLVSGVAHFRPQTAAATTIAVERIEELDSQNSFRHDPEKDPAGEREQQCFGKDNNDVSVRFVLR
jgi:hypothetical protein